MNYPYLPISPRIPSFKDKLMLIFLALIILLIIFASICKIKAETIQAPKSYWLEREKEHKELAQKKLLLIYDICEICGKEGRSSKMYRVMEFGKSFYEGEFVRLHPLCYNPLKYFLIWKPPDDNREMKDWMKQYYNNIKHIEYPNILKLFPFLRILDNYLDMTIGIVFYKVKDTRNGKIYEIYQSEDIWQKRELTGEDKPKYNFDILK